MKAPTIHCLKKNLLLKQDCEEVKLLIHVKLWMFFVESESRVEAE